MRESSTKGAGSGVGESMREDLDVYKLVAER